MREIDDDEDRRLPRIIRRGAGSVMNWRRAQMVLLCAQGMSVDKIATVTFAGPDRVREVLHNFNADGFDSLNLQPHPGCQWAERGGKHKDPDREPRPRRRAT